MNPAPVLLIILDGFGVNPSRLNNAWLQSKTPNLDHYFAHHPHTVLQASGRAVGLPDGQFGNSEVGHLTLGSGRVLEQELIRIAEAIDAGEVEAHPVWQEMLQGAERLHLVGLVSDGGVHSHIAHLIALLPLVVKVGVEPVVHVITDGRDTAPKVALKYIQQLEKAFERLGHGSIGTVSGRFWSMDRAQHWDRTEKAWRALAMGEGEHTGTAAEAVEKAYARDETDEFILPTVVGKPEHHIIAGHEPVFFFNFRNDRARQLSEALGLPGFAKFDRHGFGPHPLVCITQYKEHYPFPVLFPPEYPEQSLAEVISDAGFRQFHCAETEKFPHVTYFFNGGQEKPFKGEDRIEIPSPKVDTYDKLPQMGSAPVTDAMIAAVESGQYQFLLVNYANGDMVGHTAKPESVIDAVEAMDVQVGRLIESAIQHDVRVMLTADHGNCDEYIDPVTGEPQTQHTVYPVPFLLIGEPDAKLGVGRGLSDVAPTILELLGLSKPVPMKGRTLILKGSLEL